MACHKAAGRRTSRPRRVQLHPEKRVQGVDGGGPARGGRVGGALQPLPAASTGTADTEGGGMPVSFCVWFPKSLRRPLRVTESEGTSRETSTPSSSCRTLQTRKLRPAERMAAGPLSLLRAGRQRGLTPSSRKHTLCSWGTPGSPLPSHGTLSPLPAKCSHSCSVTQQACWGESIHYRAYK